MNDAVVLVSLGLGAWGATQVRPGSAAALTLAWSAATLVGAALGAGQAWLRPVPRQAPMWWRSTFAWAGRMLAENALANIAYALTLGSVVVWAGVTELGRLRTAQVALSPMSPVLVAMTTVVVAEGVRLMSRTSKRFPAMVGVAASASALTALGLTLVWALLPTSAAAAVIGPNWSASREFLVPWGLYVSASGVTLATAAGLRALRMPGEALRCRSWASAVSVVGATGAALGGPVWAVTWFASGEGVCAVLTARRYRAAWRRWEAAPWSVEPLRLPPRT